MSKNVVRLTPDKLLLANPIDLKDFDERCDYSHYKNDFKVLEVEGAKELDILCPVSKLTGFRMSIQEAMFMITDSNAKIADLLLQEIGVVQTSDAVSDDDKFRLLVSRLDTGSFFENDNAAEMLGNVAKQFFPDASKEKVQQIVDSASAKVSSEEIPAEAE